MFVLLLLLLGRNLLCNCHIANNPEASMETVELVRSRGYKCRIYNVTTDDGYILELHRIGNADGKRPVLVVHGLLGSDMDWVSSPTNLSLGYRLADRGYDVWMSNARGNTYSRRHVRLSPNRQSFWDFSYDEMGTYDVPANINFVLKETSRSSLVYIGHSMGTTMFYIGMATHPELNDKIDLMISLAPVASIAHLRSPVKLLAPFVKEIQKVLIGTGTRDFLSSESWTRYLQKLMCKDSRRTLLGSPNRLCQNALYFVTGADTRNFFPTVLPVIEGHYPAGTSVKTLAHFAQNYNAGKVGRRQQFLAFDHGAVRNFRRYGQVFPPAFNLSLVTAPVYLFWAQNDLISTPEDVHWLAGQLSNLKSSIKVDSPQYNHLDFLWGIDNNRLLNDPLLSLLPPP